MSELSRAADAASSGAVTRGLEDEGDFEILSNSSSSSSSSEEEDDDAMDLDVENASGGDDVGEAVAAFVKMLQQRFTAGRWEGLVTSAPGGDEGANQAGHLDEEEDDSDERRRRQKILKKQQFDAHLDAGSEASSDEEEDDDEGEEDGEHEGDEDEPKVSAPHFDFIPHAKSTTFFFSKGTGQVF